MSTMGTVFLGGTTANTTWRKVITELLPAHGVKVSHIYKTMEAVVDWNAPQLID
jgi:hypothetical protein